MGGEEGSMDGVWLQRDDVPIDVLQKTSDAIIKDCMAPASEVAAGAADVQSVQVTGIVKTQRSTGGGGVHQEEGTEVAEVAPCLDGQGIVTVANVAIVAAPDQKGGDAMLKVEEMVE